jgi:hypothetical protein
MEFNLPLDIDFNRRNLDILAAIKREERKLETLLGTERCTSRSKALGHAAEPEVLGAKKRVLPAAGRVAIAKVAKKRWAKVKKQAKKLAR